MGGGSGGGNFYGGGGGGYSPTPPSTPISNKLTKRNDLSENDKKILEEKLKELEDNCAYAALIQFTHKKNLLLNNIRMDPNIKTPAQYNYVTNEIIFRNSSSLEGNTFNEEFIHFIQNHIYEGGITKYRDKGRINLEFEAKLIQDIICQKYAPHLSGCGLLGAHGESAEAYIKWIEDLIKLPSFPNYEIVKNNYWKFMEGLKDTPEYNKPIDTNLVPQLLNYISNNACK